MRLVQVFVPGEDRDAVARVLSEMGTDAVFSDVDGGRDGSLANVLVAASAVDEVLDRLHDAGLDEDTYTVVTKVDRANAPNVGGAAARSGAGSGGERAASDAGIRERAAGLTPAWPAWPRVGWWAVAAALLALLVFVAASLTGLLVLGVFLSYAARPLADRLRPRLPDGVAAAASLLVFVVPVFVVVAVLVAVGLQELSGLDGGALMPVLDLLGPYVDASAAQNPRQFVASLLRNPSAGNLERALSTSLGVLGVVGGGLLRTSLAFALAFFILRDGDAVADWLRRLLGEGTVGHAFLADVDADLRTVYFGNVLTVVVVMVLATAFYHLFNLVAPAGLGVPLPTTLGIATGFATFVPVVVGKLVYVPVGLFLALQALSADGSPFAYLVGYFVVAFVLLDALPMTAVRPYLSGQELHGGAMMFAYVLGTVIFGWYGLFLGPLLLVVLLRFVDDVVPTLVPGDRLSVERGPTE
jgi:predicted PurR-regulated permease PerM